jgi:vesicle-fusing ATPase
MAERVVIETSLFYDEDYVNYVAISPDDVFSRTNRVEITTKQGIFEFNVAIEPFVTPGAIALNRRQRKKYHLKLYHRYFVRPCSSSKSSRTLSDIINERFDFKSRVGGMERVFEEIFGDVLLPRLYPQSFVAKTDINKTRGILLHGPPGTGKSLIARTICDLLGIHPKIVRGPEIFSFMLGESERKIRDLFEDARRDQQTRGYDSDLHVIFFDEIDTVCRNRAHPSVMRESVHDNVTTQLLAEIDGMVHLDNILLIGTTNILEAVDPALLRLGRIETVIKIELPDATARSHIFDIHTKSLIRNGALNEDVDIEHIIRSTEDMTGAHVERVVRLAIHVAMRRDILCRGKLDITQQEGEDLQVCNRDFIAALAKIQA